MSKPMIDLKTAKSLLRYDRSQGQLVWREQRAGRPAGSIAGYIDRVTGYRYIELLGRRYRAHRLVWFVCKGVWPDGIVDHKFGDRDCNRIQDLRDVSARTNAENLRKAKSNNQSTGLLGVRRSGKKFRASICVHGIERHLGNFPTAHKAHRAYVAAKRELHIGCTI